MKQTNKKKQPTGHTGLRAESKTMSVQLKEQQDTQEFSLKKSSVCFYPTDTSVPEINPTTWTRLCK